jgi:hypothetical protein
MNARCPALPPDVEAALVELGGKLARGEKLTGELDKSLDLMGGMLPATVAQADAAIATAAQLFHRRPMSSPAGLWFSLSTNSTDAELLLRVPKLEHLFIFHRDGRLREAALLKVTGGLPTPFLFAAVAWRLNDWAAPVRAAAVRCARLSFPVTNAEVVACAATALLIRQSSWGRWGNERELVDEAFSRADVAGRLAELLIASPTGPMATTLRYALRTPSIDMYLEHIVGNALQPSVRAVALDALINQRAEWPSGYEWQWVDKSMGLRRRATVFGRRDLRVLTPTNFLIELGLKDRSPYVRRVALDGVMRHLLGTPEGLAFAAPLATDRSPSVRERAEFILRRKEHSPS